MSIAQGLESCGSDLGRDNKKKNDKRSKRHLSPTEEDVLLGCLKELVATGWKSDNGFRGGYLNKLEELMGKEIPGTDLKGNPHINSKIQSWKKNYNSLNTILSLSGIGFKDQMIDCNADQWEQISKMDANAKKMRNRTFPMYETWKEIFGKDRATGEHAEDIVDAVKDLNNLGNQLFEEKVDGYYVNVDQFEANNVCEDSVCGSGNDLGRNSVCGSDRGETVSKSKGKKRKLRDSAETMAEVLREMNRDTNTRLDNIASRIGYEYDLDRARQEAFSLVENIHGLSLDDQFELCEIFAFATERLSIFKGLPESARPQYLQRLLKGKGV